MIRINLLPVREARTQAAGKQIIVLFLVLMAVEVAGLVWFQGEKDKELATVETKNKSLQAKITDLKKKTSAVATLEAQKAELQKQKQVLDGLMEGQTGPVRMLNEISMILSKIDDPEEKLRVLELGWNPDWEPTRLWLDGFTEEARGVQIVGHARTNEDLAEFLARLETSKHFHHINLQVSQTVEITKLDKAKMVQFRIEALTLYGPADVAKLASGELGKKKK